MGARIGDSVGTRVGNSHSANYVDAVLENCDVCWAFDKGLHVQIAGTSAVPMLNEQVQVDLLPSGDLIALHAMAAVS